MRKLLLIAFAVAQVFAGVASFAADAKKGAAEAKSPPKEEKQEVYIPKDLDDCFRELDKRLRPDDIEKKRKGEIEAISLHHGFGTGLRNSWGLWAGSRLAKYFNAMGIFHPDDMSGIILESYVRYLKREPLRVEEQVADYKKYWEEAKKAEEEMRKAERAEKQKKG
jgi:hypothetical protein